MAGTHITSLSLLYRAVCFRLVQVWFKSLMAVCLTVQAESLSALTNLWRLYQDGTLQKRLYDFLVTDEMRKLAEGEDVEVNVTIEGEEYQNACLELMNGAQGIVCCTVGFLLLSPPLLSQLKRFSVQSMDE